MDNNDKPKSKLNTKALKKPHYYGVVDGVHIFHGSHDDHKNHIGKHVENPSENDFKDAIKEAKDKGLHHLYIHGSPPHSLRAEIHPSLGAQIPGKLNKVEIVHDWGEDEDDYDDYFEEEEVDEDEEEEKEEDSVEKAEKKSKAIENRKIFNPMDHHGKKVKVHWNLNRDCWTVKDHDSDKLLGHTENIALVNPFYLVKESGRQDVLRQKKKGVHAHVHGEIDAYHSNFDDSANAADRTTVTYNPFKYKSFVNRNNPSEEVHQSDHVVMSGVAGGINRHGKPCNIPRVYAKGATDVMHPDVQKYKEGEAKRLAAKSATLPDDGIAKSEEANPKFKAFKDFIHQESKKYGVTVSDHHFRVKPKKTPSHPAAPKKESVKKSELKKKVQQVLKKIEQDIVTISTRELTKGLSYPESKCDACGCKVEKCLCFEGFSEPEFEFDGKKLKILFKSDWDDASKESYIDDFKRRAGRLIKK